jgi:DnaJ-domain-containing protein 1
MLSKSVSCEWREKGNEIYRSAENLSPVLRKKRLQQAISIYTNAFQTQANDDELSSAAKNLATASCRLADIVEEKFAHIYHVKEAGKYFSIAYDAGLKSKSQPWIELLLTNTRLFIDEAIQFSLNLSDFKERARLLSYIACEISEENLKALCFLNLADANFKAGISELAKGKYKECLFFMRECYHPVEEARRYGHCDPFVSTEVAIYESDIFQHQCTAESIQARSTGDDLFRSVLCDEDNLNVDMVWEVIDFYKQAILLTRERDVEFEAIGHSRLGRVYDQVLKLKVKAKENFMRCLELCNSMHPRVFTSEKWYQEATEALNRYQREVRRKEEQAWSAQKNSILLELKEDIDKLKEVSANTEDLLRHIYRAHPPKNKDHTLNESYLSGENQNMKKALRESLLHYHPDRLKAKDLGKKWIVLCEEITKFLNLRYEHYKSTS